MSEEQKGEVIVVNSSVVSAKVSDYSNDFTNYLKDLGLPYDNVLVRIDERIDVIDLIPRSLRDLSISDKREAMYISKFVAACSVGLFDAALNFLWNEVVVNLRKKVVQFDLKYFYDSVLDDNRRDKFETEEDLKKIEDWELIKGCTAIGIISDIAYKQLDHIRDMRNHASAAHPNHAELSGLGLVAWLKDCVTNVFNVSPQEDFVSVQWLLGNIRKHTYDDSELAQIRQAVSKMKSSSSVALHKAIFSIFIKTDTDVVVKNNIRKFAPDLWEIIPESQRHETAIRAAALSANGDKDRAKSAYEFLGLVSGLTYLPSDTRAAHLSHLLDVLEKTHEAMNNFYNEESIARSISQFISNSGDIPNEVRYKYVKIIISCRMGNRFGVAHSAVPIYDRLISLFTLKEIIEFFKLLNDADILFKLEFERCADAFKSIAIALMSGSSNIDINAVLMKISSATDGNQIKIVPASVEYRKLI